MPSHSFDLDDVCVDDWLEIEVNDLRQQVEEVDDKNTWLREANDKAMKEVKRVQKELAREREQSRKEAGDMNRTLTNKCVSLSNLVDEYQSLLDIYVSHTGIKLKTNKLEELRKQGGYL